MTTQEMDPADPGRVGRMSRQRKRDAVLRLLRVMGQVRGVVIVSGIR